jgi:ankyrin repeat protein
MSELLEAILSMNMPGALAAIEAGADVNVRLENGWPALTMVIQLGGSKLATAMIERGADVNAATPEGETPLLQAARQARPIAKLLLERGADPHARDKEGATALHLAAGYKLPPMPPGRTLPPDYPTDPGAAFCALLLDAGADPNAVAQGRTALNSAASTGTAATLALLLARGAQASSNELVLRDAAYSQVEALEKVRALMEAGANAATPGVLIAALTQPNDETTQTLLELLLDAGADVNGALEGRVPLALALQARDLPIVELLLERGAEPARVQYPLRLAVASDLEPVAKLELLLDRGVDPREPGIVGQVGYSLEDEEASEVAQRLLKAGAAVDDWTPGQEDARWNALAWAIVKRNTELVAVLLEHGARSDFTIARMVHNSGPAMVGMTPADLAEQAALKSFVPRLRAGASAGTSAGGRPRPVAPFEGEAFVREQYPAFRDVTLALLVAGRRVEEASMTRGQVAALCELTHQWAARLHKPLLCAVGDDPRDYNDEGDDAQLYPNVVIGLEIAHAAADDRRPRAVEASHIEAAQRAAEDLPPEFWEAVAAALPSGQREQFLEQEAGVWLVSAGPLAMATLSYGVISEEREALGLVWERGRDSDQRDHTVGALGVSVEGAAYDGESAVAVDMSAATHEGRVAATAGLGSGCSYLLMAQYD